MSSLPCSTAGHAITLRNYVIPYHTSPPTEVPTGHQPPPPVDLCWGSMQLLPGRFEVDKTYINDLGGRSYMAGVSPWFFTHYGPETYNKKFIYRCDDWRLRRGGR
ncbi:hypothetical protein LshimejAT787_0904200 [Lyophyllum shimeji]|uniref:Uncharacterized protein n=1 Tax=Lyophyllum shimeji TaxID=47721 RepID=A0A9P3PR65_LYOSH|nr:hypothetical protein LshimejAT787_0904200 [Lyophyllum shimeji]